MNKIFSSALRYGRTLRYLRPVQIYGRIWFRAYRPRPNLRAAPARRQPCQKYLPPPNRPSSLVGPDAFSFLNQTGSVSKAADWNHTAAEMLWLYNLHYFDDLNAVEADERAAWHEALLKRWVEENLPGHGIGWDPYPTSLRIVNWIQWSLCGGELPGSCVDSLAVQARWLRQRLEYHLLGNHLFANAKALIFVGLYFEGGEAEGWLRRGLSILSRELAEQVLDDGGHFERSPMYHLILLEDCLDLLNVHDAFGVARPPSLVSAAIAMMRWAALMRHPDGGIPFFNDAAFGIAPEPADVLDYGKRLSVPPGSADLSGTHALAASGYVRLSDEHACAFFDAASIGPDYLPGHAHADTLSVEASFYGARVLVNSGTSVYGLGAQRQWQRSTAAHNTITVDGADSSEVWSGFRVARRAKVHDPCVVPAQSRASAWHDGFKRLAGSPIHGRNVRLRNSVLIVEDEITGHGEHAVVGRWYLHPAVEVAWMRESPDHVRARLDLALEDQVQALDLIITGADSVELAEGTFHPRFGVSESCRALVYSAFKTLPVRFGMRLAPHPHLEMR